MAHGRYKLKKRDPYKFTDLKFVDIDHLRGLYYHTNRTPDNIYCLGNSFWILKELNLVTSSFRITLDGIEFLKELYAKQMEAT